MNITIDTRELERAAKAIGGFSDRRLAATIATALTRTARAVEADWRRQFAAELDRPTPLTQRAAVVIGAKADNLRAEVKLRDATARGTAPAEYLAPQEAGGDRRLKRFEQALVRAGAMPAGQRAVPGEGAQRDGYGNVSRAQIVQVLNQLAAGRTSVGYSRVIGRTAEKRAASARRAGRVYVALPQGSGPISPGIYERQGRGLKAVFLFVSSVRYRSRLKLIEQGGSVAARVVQAEGVRALGEQVQRLRDKIARGGA